MTAFVNSNIITNFASLATLHRATGGELGSNIVVWSDGSLRSSTFNGGVETHTQIVTNDTVNGMKFISFAEVQAQHASNGGVVNNGQEFITVINGQAQTVSYKAGGVETHVNEIAVPAPVAPVVAPAPVPRVISFERGDVVTAAEVMAVYNNAGANSDTQYGMQNAYLKATTGMTLVQLSKAPGYDMVSAITRADTDLRQAFTDESLVITNNLTKGINAVISRMTENAAKGLSREQAEAINNGGSVELYAATGAHSVAVTETSLLATLNGLGQSDKIVLAQALAPTLNGMSYDALFTLPGVTTVAQAVGQFMYALNFQVQAGTNSAAIADAFAYSGIDTIQSLDAVELQLIGVGETVYDLQLIG